MVKCRQLHNHENSICSNYVSRVFKLDLTALFIAAKGKQVYLI